MAPRESSPVAGAGPTRAPLEPPPPPASGKSPAGRSSRGGCGAGNSTAGILQIASLSSLVLLALVLACRQPALVLGRRAHIQSPGGPSSSVKYWPASRSSSSSSLAGGDESGEAQQAGLDVRIIENLLKNRQNPNNNNHGKSGKNTKRPSEGPPRERRRKRQEAYLDQNAADRPVVATSKGLVKGITQKIFTGKFVDAYLGIPFGQAPKGKYRFRHPQPVQPWEGELDASKMSNSCYQVNDTFFGATFGGTSIWNANTPLDEDCLHLNIWTPFAAANTIISNSPPVGQKNSSLFLSSQTSSSQSHSSGQQRHSSTPGTGGRGGSRATSESPTTTTKRSVLVWIFGGGFYSGTPTLSLYEGGALASEEELIVVSINYRVSALGFLYFGRSDAPGNAGLFDQLLALQWIQDNIHQFGGDPDQVTIFGESAGAVSVAFHLLSPLSRNLFSQAIMQSGAATCPWGSMSAREIMANGLQLAAALGCPSNASDLDAVIECLLRAHPMALVSQEVGQTQSSILNFPFVPVVDGSFLLEPPGESLAKGNFKPARILLGSNNDEGNAWLIYMPEFSHCPSSASSSSSAATAAESSLSAGTPAPGPGAAPTTNTGLTGGGGSPKPTEAEDELSESSGPVARQVVARSPATTTTNQKQQQQQQQQIEQLYAQNANETKPCKPNENLQLTREDFLRVLREDLNPYAEHPLGKKAIVFEYSNWVNPLDVVSNYDALDKIVGDYYFTCHVNEFAQQYAQAGNPVYMYYFKQRSSISPWPKWMGVIHADEINFVFGEPLNPAFNYTKKEVDLSRRMMRYWANFARFGNPTHQAENASQATATQAGSPVVPFERWPEYSAERRQYFELHSEYIRVGRGPRAKQCAFWSHYLPQLIQTYDKNGQCPSAGSSSSSSSSPRLNLRQPYGGIGGMEDADEGDDFGRPSLGAGRHHPNRRFRNRRAAASRQRSQAAAAAAAATATTTTTNMVGGVATTTTTTSTGGTGTMAANAQNQSGPTNNSAAAGANLKGANSLAGGVAAGQSNYLAGAQLMRMQNIHSSSSGTAATGLARQTQLAQPSITSGGPVGLQRQQTLLSSIGAPTGASGSGAADQQQEQSALDFAQSAAARVTATGSAAAAMAAAKFKMLRSNTLAAAFGKPVAAEGDAASSSGAPGTLGANLGPSGAQAASASSANLIAVFTRDERVSTVSSPSSRLNKFDFS